MGSNKYSGVKRSNKHDENLIKHIYFLQELYPVNRLTDYGLYSYNLYMYVYVKFLGIFNV